jgi:arsenite methyltransferase
VTVQKERAITIPEDISLKFVTLDELRDFTKRKIGIFSITDYADKP